MFWFFNRYVANIGVQARKRAVSEAHSLLLRACLLSAWLPCFGPWGFEKSPIVFVRKVAQLSACDGRKFPSLDMHETIRISINRVPKLSI